MRETTHNLKDQRTPDIEPPHMVLQDTIILQEHSRFIESPSIQFWPLVLPPHQAAPVTRHSIRTIKIQRRLFRLARIPPQKMMHSSSK